MRRTRRIAALITAAAMAVVPVACATEPATTKPTSFTPSTPPSSTSLPPATPGGPAASTTTSPPASSTDAAPSTTTTAAVADAVESLRGLAFDGFVEESFEALLLRSPETLTGYGLAARFGLRNDRLDDRSDAFLRETMALESAILDLLRGFERATLDSSQQLAYDVYEWTLDDRVRGHRFAYHDYPLNSFLFSYHFQTVDFFTDTFPLETPADAEDYVACVSQIRRQASQVLEGLRIREELGVVPPDFDVAMTRSAMIGQLGLRTGDPADVEPTALAVFTRFAADTEDIDGLDAARRAALLDELATQLTESFVPAWMELIRYLAHLEDVATPDAGVWKLPNGADYYAYLLRSETSTDLSADDIHRIGLVEVDRIRGELRRLFGELGYPSDERFEESMSRVLQEGGVYDTRRQGPGVVVEAYEGILDEIGARVDAVFGLLPEGGVEVVGEMGFPGGGGYYLSGSLDGSRPGSFHTGVAPGTVARYRMPTIAYHEAIPGHHFQITIAQELGLPLMQTLAFFNGYAEGWALYAERLAKELGMYEDDPYGDAGRLHLELLRAVRLVTDTGIHALGWSREEAKAYVNEAMGERGGRSDGEVDRYIVLPAQATGYLIGMLEILDMRRRAEAALGTSFDIAAFHDVILGHGSVPLEVLDRLVDEWIDAAASG